MEYGVKSFVQPLGLGPSCDHFKGGVERCHRPVGSQSEDDIRRIFNKIPVPLFRFSQGLLRLLAFSDVAGNDVKPNHSSLFNHKGGVLSEPYNLSSFVKKWKFNIGQI